MLRPLDIYVSDPTSRIDWQVFNLISQQTYWQAAFCGMGTRPTIEIAVEAKHPITAELEAGVEEQIRRSV